MLNVNWVLMLAFAELTSQWGKWAIKESKQMNTNIVTNCIRCYKEKKQGSVRREVGV